MSLLGTAWRASRIVYNKQKCCVIRPQEQGSQRYENSYKPWSSFYFPSKFKKSGVLGELKAMER